MMFSILKKKEDSGGYRTQVLEITSVVFLVYRSIDQMTSSDPTDP